MAATVSVIIDSYNYARFLAQAIDSALAQTHRNTEVIVVDDGSTDDSPAIIRSYGSRVTPILKRNEGQASAFNAGFAASTGDAIIFLDSDDVLHPSATATVAHNLDASAAKLHWPMTVIDDRGQPTGKLHPQAELSEGDLREAVLRDGPDAYDWPPTSGNAWLRRFLTKVMPIPQEQFRLCADLYLSCLAPLFGNVKRLNEPVSSWRIHGTNNTLSEPFEKRIESLARRFDLGCQALSVAGGIVVEPPAWRENAWCHRVLASLGEIDTAIPRDAPFILIDNNDWATDGTIRRRKCLRFIERDNEYFGLPADDDEALSELGRSLRREVRYLVLAWPAFWWLEHYPGFARRLLSARILLQNDRLSIFDLS